MYNFNKRFLLLLISIVAMSLILIGCGNSEESSIENSNENDGETNEAEIDPTELTYASSFSQGHYIPQNVDTKMFERIEEETGGNVTFNTFYDATLVSPQDWYQELVQGSTDIVEAPIGIEKDRFELEYATGLFNYGITDLNILLEFTRTLEDLTPELKELYEDIVPLSRQTAGQAYVHTNKKPIRSVEDFKGLNLKVADDASVELAKALGANGVRIPIAETYTALEKGTIDGVITGGDPLNSFKFAEVTKYTTELPYATPWISGVFINKEVFDNLSSDLQEIILSNGLTWEEDLIVAIDQEIEAGLEAAKDEGNEIIQLSPEETEKILIVMEENALEIAAELDAAGYNGTELFNNAREIADRLLQ